MCLPYPMSNGPSVCEAFSVIFGLVGITFVLWLLTPIAFADFHHGLVKEKFFGMYM